MYWDKILKRKEWRRRYRPGMVDYVDRPRSAWTDWSTHSYGTLFWIKSDVRDCSPVFNEFVSRTGTFLLTRKRWARARRSERDTELWRK